MKEATATEAKNRFGQILDQAMTEPVAIDKNGRPVAVLLSFAEYQRLAEIEDRYWGERAQQALKSGFAGTEESRAWLEGKLNAGADD